MPARAGAKSLTSTQAKKQFSLAIIRIDNLNELNSFFSEDAIQFVRELTWQS